MNQKQREQIVAVIAELQRILDADSDVRLLMSSAGGGKNTFGFIGNTSELPALVAPALVEVAAQSLKSGGDLAQAVTELHLALADCCCAVMADREIRKQMN